MTVLGEGQRVDRAAVGTGRQPCGDASPMEHVGAWQRGGLVAGFKITHADGADIRVFRPSSNGVRGKSVQHSLAHGSAKSGKYGKPRIKSEQ